MSMRTQAIAVGLGVQLVRSGLNTTNLDWPNLTLDRVGLLAPHWPISPMLVPEVEGQIPNPTGHRGNPNLDVSLETLATPANLDVTSLLLVNAFLPKS